MLRMRASFVGGLAAATSAPALAAGGGGIPKTISFYEMILHALHLGHAWYATVGGVFVLILITLMGLRYKSQVEKSSDVTPSGRFSLRFMIEGIMDFLYNLTKENCGERYRSFLPLLCGLFLFILLCNLTGLVPGFPPATVSINTNLAMGLSVFLVYNYAGVKEHGAAYVKQFLGPVVFIAPLFFVIELISHMSRPFSLSLRLLGNIFGDHTLVSVFTSLSYIGFPALLLFFGLLVAVVQSYVFTLLTGIYVSLAISHDH